ncbi:MAG: CoA-transferase [Chloroflexi bacterium RBG_16_64_32]|nr:MAG: CoA-transferase [Chloroflexi bacterium RBG_16_64_32]
MDVLASGIGEFRKPDPDGYREYVRTHKERRLVSKVMSEHDAISRFVEDGDYLAYDQNVAVRGPTSLFREIIRQRKKDLWIAAKFTWSDASLLVAGGCVSKIDVGWMATGRLINEAIRKGELKLIDWTNGALAYRHLAGSLGVSFLPMRYLVGTDTFTQSGAKVIEDPFTSQPICLVPALYPDVAIIHVQQCDIYGDARVLGAGVAPMEIAMSSKKLIISTEEIIDHEAIRRQPQRTTIPYYFVDAVVVAPFGCYPGSTPGLYGADIEHWMQFGAAEMQGKTDEYLENWVFSVASHEEMLDKRVGAAKLLKLRQAETVREGYYE